MGTTCSEVTVNNIRGGIKYEGVNPTYLILFLLPGCRCVLQTLKSCLGILKFVLFLFTSSRCSSYIINCGVDTTDADIDIYYLQTLHMGEVPQMK